MKFGLDRAPDADLRYPIDPLKAGADTALHEVVESLGGEVRVGGGEADPGDVINRVDIDRFDGGLEDAVGIAGDFIEFLKGVGGGFFDIGSGFKLHADGALAVGGGGGE